MPSRFAVSIAAFLAWLMSGRLFAACGPFARKGARLGWIALLVSWLAVPALAVAQTALVHDGVVSGSITAAGEEDEFTFDASTGDEVLIRAAKTGGDTYFTPYIWLYNPDGTLLTTASGGVAALDCSPRSSTCQLNQSGTYRLLVMDGHSYLYSDKGTYDIHYVRPPESNQNGYLVHDDVVSGEVAAAGDINSFLFDANAGDEVLIRAAKTGGDTYFTPYIWLYNPDGTLLTTASGGVAALDCSPRSSTCRIEQTGTRQLLKMDDGYNLILSKATPVWVR